MNPGVADGGDGPRPVVANAPDRTDLLGVLDSVTDAVLTVDADWRVTYLNAVATTRIGAVTDVLGHPLFDLVPVLEHSRFHDACSRAWQKGQAQHVTTFSRAFQTWFECDVYPGESRLTIFFREPVERIRGEIAAELRSRVTSRVERSNGTVAALVDAVDELRAATGYPVGKLWLRDRSGTVRLTSIQHEDTPAYAAFARATWNLPPEQDVEIGQVIELREPLVIEDLQEQASTPRARATAQAGLGSAIYLPIWWSDGICAILGLLTPSHLDDDWFAVLRQLHPEIEELATGLRHRHELARVFDLAQEIVCICGVDGWFHRVNPEFGRLLGYSSDELLSRPFDFFVHPDDLEDSHAEMANLLAGGTTNDFENRFLAADGSYHHLSWVARGVAEEGLIYAAARDVTDARHQARFEADQRGLLQSIAAGEPLDAILHRLVAAMEARFSGARSAVWLLDRESDTLWAAAAPSLPDEYLADVGPVPLARGSGSAGTAAATRETVVITDVEDDPRAETFRDVAVANGLRASWSAPFLDQDEAVGVFTLYPAEAREPDEGERQVIEDAARLAGLAVGHHRAQAALIESEERFRLLADAISDAVWDWDLVTDEAWCSSAYAELVGLEDAADVDSALWRRCVHADDRARVFESLDLALEGDAEHWEQEYRHVGVDGREVVLLDRARILRDEQGQATRMIGGIVDLTEQRAFEQQQLRNQRLENIGSLASGVAHDLNNVLAPIMMAADLLQRKDLDDDHRRLVELIEASAQRGGRMVRQVLTFAKGAEGDRVTVDPGALLDEIHEIARDSMPKSLRLETEIDEDSWPLIGDPTQLHQVLLNLLVNARDAVAGEGVVRLSVTNVHLDEAYAATHPEAAPGPHVLFSVADDGPGLPPEVRERIFEPFFTTKGAGAGTGLGLSTSQAIVQGHGGFFDVDSTPDVGTTMRVYLPADADAARTGAAATEAAAEHRGEGELVLIVDDEPDVRATCGQTLEAFGYRTLLAEDGAEAMAVFARHHQEISVVLVDMMMPVMGGLALVRALRHYDDTVPLLVTSGLTAEGEVAAAHEAGASGFLAKPYNVQTLLRAIEQPLRTDAAED